MTTTKQTVLDDFATEHAFVAERILARRELDAAIKRGQLNESEVLDAIAHAIARQRARGLLSQVAGDVQLGRSSGE